MYQLRHLAQAIYLIPDAWLHFHSENHRFNYLTVSGRELTRRGVIGTTQPGVGMSSSMHQGKYHDALCSVTPEHDIIRKLF